MKILSIQSSVAYGHVGNSAAVFPLQRLGHEVWPVLTVHFSNHTGYGAWRGPLLDPADVREVIAGIDDRGVLGECDAVLSGYQGDPAVGAVILDAVARVKAANPDAVYCCDPVMGDVGRGMFVRPGIPEFMRDTVVPQADILTPNHFELDFLAGAHDHAPSTRCWPRSTRSATAGPRDVLVTSVLHGDVPAGLAGRRRGLRRGRVGGHHAPAADHAERLRRRHRRALPRAPHARPARRRRRWSATTASVFAVLEATLAAGTREIQLVAAQDAIADPPETLRRAPAALVRRVGHASAVTDDAVRHVDRAGTRAPAWMNGTFSVVEPLSRLNSDFVAPDEPSGIASPSSPISLRPYFWWSVSMAMASGVRGSRLSTVSRRPAARRAAPPGRSGPAGSAGGPRRRCGLAHVAPRSTPAGPIGGHESR